MKILKFGGTSVGTAQRMQHVAKLVDTTPGSVVVVLSAVAGTTNALTEICAKATSRDMEACRLLTKKLYRHYEEFTSELFSSEKMEEQGRAAVNNYFKMLGELIDTPFGIVRDKEILALGELMSTKLFELYNREQGRTFKWLNALDFMLVRDGEPDIVQIGNQLIPHIPDSRDDKRFITQGFICRNEHGEVDNLKRGGSDFTASILGAVLDAEEIQIWTDIDGIHNNDPRVVDNTSPVHELSYGEAAELAYFGAKILHPSTVHPAHQKAIPVRLLNTMKPEARGTLITSRTTSSDRPVKAIAAKDGIAAINIKSHRMLLAYGFLRKVFEIFEKYRTPIDMITTSEVAVSVTIDDLSFLEEIGNELQVLGDITVDRDQTIICIVGDFSKDEGGIAVRILESIRDIPIRMIASGGSESNISLLVDTEHKKKTLEALNKGLFGR